MNTQNPQPFSFVAVSASPYERRVQYRKALTEREKRRIGLYAGMLDELDFARPEKARLIGRFDFARYSLRGSPIALARAAE